MNTQTDPTTFFVVVRGAIPAELSIGKIYVNLGRTRAHHLCACGCGERVLTPLNRHEWQLTGTDLNPSLTPSVGNWNLKCQSHYWIRKGKIAWAPRWTPEEIAAGRAKEQRPYVEDASKGKDRSWFASIAALIFRAGK